MLTKKKPVDRNLRESRRNWNIIIIIIYILKLSAKFLKHSQDEEPLVDLSRFYTFKKNKEGLFIIQVL